MSANGFGGRLIGVAAGAGLALIAASFMPAWGAGEAKAPPAAATSADAPKPPPATATAAPIQGATEREFEKLYKQYSSRFYERMSTVNPEQMPPMQVTAMAASIWDEVFPLHKDLLKKRCEEILKDLDAAPPLGEELYAEVASGVRNEPAPDQPKGIILKQFLWSPLGAAQMALQQGSFQMRTVMTTNAGLFWEAVDRNIDKPKLMLRQGSMIFLVELSRKDDYYQVDKIRWLRPVGAIPAPAPAPPSGVPAVTPAPRN
jgi:hypothetical protein